MAGISLERDGVPDVVEACYEHDEAFKAHAEAGVGHCPVPAQVQVLPVAVEGHTCSLHALFQYLQSHSQCLSPFSTNQFVLVQDPARKMERPNACRAWKHKPDVCIAIGLDRRGTTSQNVYVQPWWE